MEDRQNWQIISDQSASEEILKEPQVESYKQFKEVKKALRDENLIDYIKQGAMNTYYYMNSLIGADIRQDLEEAYFMGRKINLVDEEYRKYLVMAECEEGQNLQHDGQRYLYIMKQLQKQVLWMTYRKQFQKLLGNTDYCDDNGWGCVIRVGQMILAQAFKTHFFGRRQEIANRVDLLSILIAFVDDDYGHDSFGHFSIQKIAREGYEQFKVQPGIWYNLNQILFVIEKLHEKSKKKKQGTQDLAIKMYCTAHDFVNFQQLAELMGLKLCRHSEQQKKDPNQTPHVFCDQCKQELEQKQQQSPEETKVKSLVLFIQLKIGNERPEEKYQKILNKLFQHEYCIGMIGGKKDRAYYFTGIIDKYYSYLDPHNVQPAVDNIKISSLLDTYFCNEFFLTKQSEVASSFGIGFYIKDGQELEKFWQFLNKQQKCEQDFCILIEREKPKHQNLDFYIMDSII